MYHTIQRTRFNIVYLYVSFVGDDVKIRPQPIIRQHIEMEKNAKVCRAKTCLTHVLY
jgi:hypothetical protein